MRFALVRDHKHRPRPSFGTELCLDPTVCDHCLTHLDAFVQCMCKAANVRRLGNALQALMFVASGSTLAVAPVTTHGQDQLVNGSSDRAASAERKL